MLSKKAIFIKILILKIICLYCLEKSLIWKTSNPDDTGHEITIFVPIHFSKN